MIFETIENDALLKTAFTSFLEKTNQKIDNTTAFFESLQQEPVNEQKVRAVMFNLSGLINAYYWVRFLLEPVDELEKELDKEDNDIDTETFLLLARLFLKIDALMNNMMHYVFHEHKELVDIAFLFTLIETHIDSTHLGLSMTRLEPSKNSTMCAILKAKGDDLLKMLAQASQSLYS